MNICIVIDDYLPDSIKIAAKMIHELACEYIRVGHQVTVMTPNPNLLERFHCFNLEGVQVIQFKSGKIKNINKMRRAINETLLPWFAWISCRNFVKTNKHDLIIYYSPSIFFGFFIRKLKNIWGVKSYLILRDFFPQWTIDNGMMRKSSMITKYFQFFEKINYRSADKIGVMSPKNLAWFAKYYPTKTPVEVLYNWTKIDPIKQQDHYKKKLGLVKKIVYFYGGNIGQAQDMMNIVRLAVNMKQHKDAFFVMVGSGDEVDLVESAIKKYKLKNMLLFPPVNQKDYLKMLSSFDVGLFSLNKNHITHNFPGKILGYMKYGLPILGSINRGNDLQDMVNQYEAGKISINGEDDVFFEHAKYLLNNSNWGNLSHNAKQLLLDKFSVENASQQILETFSSSISV